MCGIFGFISTSPKKAESILEGLRILEYRGYDSWGIAIKNKTSNTRNDLFIEKHIGKIADSDINKSKILEKKTTIGIGHTRWATHGGVTVKNAHPHSDCNNKLAIVHNGIVENFQELKNELIKNGHKFQSQTDTEIIVHLIEKELKNKEFKDAVFEVFLKLKGLNAIVVINSENNELIAAKNGSPLIIGYEKDGYLVASDLTPILPYTNKVLILDDNELVHINKSLSLYSMPSGTKLKPRIENINWLPEKSTQGKFDHFMIKEISEQPSVIRNITQNYSPQITNLSNLINQAQETFFIAAGTAYNAALSGIYLFSKVSKIHINAALASEFNYLLDFINQKSLIVALSQSGETIDVIEPLKYAHKKGALITGIINNLGSTLYRMADEKILLNAGPEKAVASTKAYTAKLSVLLLTSYKLARNERDIKKQLLLAADEIENMLNLKFIKKIKILAKELSHVNHIYTLGRGVSYPTALEAALKIKEVSYIPTEGLAGGELKHGTIALIEKGTPVIVFAPNDETYEAMISNAIEIKSRGGKIIGISFKNTPVFDNFIEIKDLGNASILTQIVPAQLLAYYMALNLGLDPDKPRNLAKSVTVK